MGVEIKHTLERNFDVSLSTNDIRQITIKQLENINNGEVTQDKLSSDNTKYETTIKVPR